MSGLSFKHEDAYKMLLRFRQASEAISGFMLLSNATIFITDVARHQLIIASAKDEKLIGSVYNFSHSPYGDIFDGLCATCSSASPMIVDHTLTSKDDKIFYAFESSRLGQFAVDVKMSRPSDAHDLTLTAKIRYPS